VSGNPNLTLRHTREDRTKWERAVERLRQRDESRRSTLPLFAEDSAPAPLFDTAEEWTLASFLRLVANAAADMVLSASTAEAAELPHERAHRLLEHAEDLTARCLQLEQDLEDLETGATFAAPEDVLEDDGAEGVAA
jgi:hypothetical protein